MLKKGSFYCFSPPVMIATFAIEFCLAIYAVWRYKMSWTVRIAVMMLVFLATFQFAEYYVCTGSLAANFWSRAGYMAITMLPPLGLHFTHLIAKQKAGVMVKAAYLAGILFALIFGLHPDAFAEHVCTGNYVIFQLIAPLGAMYFVYYYALLFIGIYKCIQFMVSSSKRVRKALRLQVMGYLSFLLPTAILNTINPQTIEGIPSIMCGFAVIYALILGFGILPLVAKKKK